MILAKSKPAETPVAAPAAAVISTPTNVANYEPGVVSEFDVTRAQKIFDAIVGSIRFATE